MKKFDAAVAEDLALAVLHHEQVRYTRGEMPRIVLFGLKVSGNRVEGLTELADIRVGAEEIQRLTDVARARFDAVAVVSTGVGAPDRLSRHMARKHPQAFEALLITLLVQGVTYVLESRVNAFSRTFEPTGFGRQGAHGQMVVDARMEDVAVKRLTGRLQKVMREQLPNWRQEVRSFATRLMDAQHISELFVAISDPHLPPDAVRYAQGYFNRHCETRPSPRSTPQRRACLWLLGLVLRVKMDGPKAVSLDHYALAESIDRELLARGAYADETFRMLRAEELPLLVTGYLPASLLSNVLAESATLGKLSGRWREGRSGTDVQSRAIAALEKKAERPFSDSQDEVFLCMCSLEVEVPIGYDLEDPDQEPAALRAAIGRLTPVVELAVAAAAQQLQLRVLSTLLPAFEGMWEIYSAEKRRELAGLYSAIDSGLDPATVAVKIGYAEIDTPPHERVYTLGYTPAGRLAVATNYQRMPHETYPAILEEFAALLRAAGVTDITISPHVSRAPTVPREPGGGPQLTADFHGGWHNHVDITFPGARELVRRVVWFDEYNPLIEDPVVKVLPGPHLLLRLGLVETAQSKYQPEPYRLLKELLCDVSLDSHEVWERMTARWPVISTLEQRIPYSAKPEPFREYSLRLHWSRSPTLQVRRTMIERMNYTDINLQLPAQLFHAPFPLCYIHFAGRLESVEWQVPTNEAGDKETNAVVLLEGCFVPTIKREGRRSVYLLLLGRAREEVALSVTHEVLLEIVDETDSIESAIRLFQKRENLSDENLADLRPAIEEIAKVLLYMGMKDARMVANPARSAILREGKGKPFDKQAKLQHKARGNYDSILIGPEKGLELPSGHGLTGRTMPVHVRRGFVNHYWTGKGRTVLRAVQIDPVVVNKRLLKDPDQAPAPKDYKLK